MHIKFTITLISVMFSLALVLVFANLTVNLSVDSHIHLKSVKSTETMLQEYTQSKYFKPLVIAASQASHFNHSQQLNIEYGFVCLIALFIALVYFSYHNIIIVRAPPWYSLLRSLKRSRLSGWKESNLLYKGKLTYQH